MPSGAIIHGIPIKNRKRNRRGSQVEQVQEVNQEIQEKMLTAPTSEAADN